MSEHSWPENAHGVSACRPGQAGGSRSGSARRMKQRTDEHAVTHRIRPAQDQGLELHILSAVMQASDGRCRTRNLTTGARAQLRCIHGKARRTSCASIHEPSVQTIRAIATAWPDCAASTTRSLSPKTTRVVGLSCSAIQREKI